MAAPVLIHILRRAGILLSGCACLLPAAHADDEAVQRALLERQQQSDAFALQLQQHQQRLQAPPARRQALESLQLQQRLDLDALADAQRVRLRMAPAEAASGVVWGPRLESALPQLAREREAIIVGSGTSSR